MAKEKRSAADLDAELAALEAEIAALEGKKPKAKKRDAPAAKPAPVAPAPSEAAPSEAAPEKRGRFALPKIGRKKEEPAPPAPPEPEPMAAPVAAAAPRAPPVRPAETYDLTHWRQDGQTWVRAVPETPVPIMRRVLDESGEMLREETATQRDLDQATGVKAERGLGRLLRRK